MLENKGMDGNGPLREVHIGSGMITFTAPHGQRNSSDNLARNGICQLLQETPRPSGSKSPNQSGESGGRGFRASLASLLCIFEIVLIILNHVLSIKLSQIEAKIIRNYSNKSSNDSKVLRHDFEQNSPMGKSMSEPKVFSRVHPRVKPRVKSQ